MALFAAQDRGAGAGLAADRPPALRRVGGAAGSRSDVETGADAGRRVSLELPVVNEDPEADDDDAEDGHRFA